MRRARAEDVRITRRLGLAVAIVQLTACASGGDDPVAQEQLPTQAPEIVSAPRQGTASFEGQVDERDFVVADARVLVGALSARDPGRHGLRVVLADHAGLCQRPDVMRPGARALSLEMDLGDAPMGPASYAVTATADALTAAARFDSMSVTCANKAFLAIAGAITIEEADEAHVRGAFALTLGRNTVHGVFDAVPCETPTPPPFTTRCEP